LVTPFVYDTLYRAVTYYYILVQVPCQTWQHVKSMAWHMMLMGHWLMFGQWYVIILIIIYC